MIDWKNFVTIVAAILTAETVIMLCRKRFGRPGEQT